MTMTDPIADMLTRIRNAVRNRAPHVDMPTSTQKESIAAVLKAEGFVKDYGVTDAVPCRSMRVYLKYGPDGEKVINSIERASKPGRRLYLGTDELPRVLDGLGIAIVSTPKGVMSDREARRQHVGGELIAKVW